MAQNLLNYSYLEKMKLHFFLNDALKDIANEIGANLEETWPKKHQYLMEIDRHKVKLEKTLENNLDGYITSKQLLVDCFRKMEPCKKSFD